MTLRVSIREPAGENFNGVPLAFSDTLLLLWSVYDFQPWGYVAIPRRSIATFRSGRFERFADRVIAGEGLIPRVRARARVRLDSMHSLFDDLRRRRQNIALETVAPLRTGVPYQSSFHLGRITAVEDDAVFLRTVTALGGWDRRPRRIDFESVEYVEFDDPYTRTFSKYAPFPAS